MKNIFFIIGNYGVGKSTNIRYEIIKKETIFLEIFNNVWILGETTEGADTLSKYKKEDIINKVVENKTKNIIITGNYYCQYVDYEKLAKHFNLKTIYLKTDFVTNANRIAKRGKNINVETYNQKLKSHLSLLNKVKKMSKIFIVDNNKDIEIVKPFIKKIILNETN
jgi:dephospho-CoA kinase